MAGYPIGLRNNNPGNIRPGDNWQGMIGTNGGFVVFKDIAYGIRAMATDLGNDMRLKGLNTIRKLVTEYAPPSENDTAAYIRSMERYTGFTADQALPATQATLLRLIRGHMNVELGDQYSSLITDADILAGLTIVNKSLLDYFKITPLVATSGAAILIGAGLLLWYFTNKKM